MKQSYLFGKEVNLLFFKCEPTLDNIKKAPPVVLPDNTPAKSNKAKKGVEGFVEGSIDNEIEVLKGRIKDLEVEIESYKGLDPGNPGTKVKELENQIAEYNNEIALYESKKESYTDHVANKCFIIDTSRPGVKPEVSLSLKMLPGNLAYEINITITNYVPKVDLRNFNYIFVEAGYSNMSTNVEMYAKRCFIMKVFHIDNRSPNPGGIINIIGVEVTKIGDTLHTQPITVHFNNGFDKKHLRFDEFVKGIFHNEGGIADLGYNYSLHLDDWYKGAPVGSNEYEENYRPLLVMNEKRHELSDIVELVRWLQLICDSLVAVRKDYAKTKQVKDLMKDERIQVILSPATKDGVTKTTIYFISTHFQEVIPKEQLDPRFSNLIYIDKMYSAPAFENSWCTIKAPWNPNVQPDSLICFLTRFWEGGNATNLYVPTDIFISQSNIYRVILMELNFSSTGDTNEMVINCVKYEYTDPELAKQFAEYQNLTTEEFAKAEKSTTVTVQPTRNIYFGGQENIPVLEVYSSLKSLKNYKPLGYITVSGKHYIDRDGKEDPISLCEQGDEEKGLSQVAGKLYPTQYIPLFYLDGFEDEEYYIDENGRYKLKKVKTRSATGYESFQGGYMWPLIYGLTQVHKDAMYKNVPFIVDNTSADKLQVNWALAYTQEQTWIKFIENNPKCKDDFIKLLEAGADLIKSRFINKTKADHNYGTASDDFFGARAMRKLAYVISKIPKSDISKVSKEISNLYKVRSK